MQWKDTEWTIDNYISIGTFVFGLIGAVFLAYVAMVSKDVRTEVTDDFRGKQLEEVNARLLNLNERMRDGFKEMKQDIDELDEKNVGKEAFKDFKYDNNRRWDNINQDMQYLRSLKRMDVAPYPVSNGNKNE